MYKTTDLAYVNPYRILSIVVTVKTAYLSLKIDNLSRGHGGHEDNLGFNFDNQMLEIGVVMVMVVVMIIVH